MRDVNNQTSLPMCIPIAQVIQNNVSRNLLTISRTNTLDAILKGPPLKIKKKNHKKKKPRDFDSFRRDCKERYDMGDNPGNTRYIVRNLVATPNLKKQGVRSLLSFPSS